ncbi:ATP-binding protein [Actinophytocola sp.]|uniref:ATP-binding protein n=1 Tax=Actinophytocola sp. TaxID=1872138 RepID=UPI00389A4E16
MEHALAVHLAHELRQAYPDGQLYVDLHGASSDPTRPDDVLTGFLTAMGYNRAIPEAIEERQRLYRTVLSERRLLVLLDNAADEAQVRPLLPGGAGCVVFVTSRRPLAALERAHLVALDVLAPSAARALLARFVGAERVRLEPDAAADIARLCGHLPLALCIAGGRLAARRHWPLERLAERLSDERRRLDELAVGDRAVRASFNLSYRNLDPVERRVFRLLGLIEATDFPAWVAAALLAVTVEEAEDAIERLVDVQLLEPGGSAEEALPRYRFHDLIRVYAWERADAEEPAPDRLVAVSSMVYEYLAMGELAWVMEPGRSLAESSAEANRWARQHLGSPPSGGVDWFHVELDGFVAAQRQAHRAGLWEPTWRLGALLAPFFVRSAHGGDSELTKNLALDAARQAGDRRAEADALALYSGLFLNRAAWDEAADRLRQAQDIYVELGNREGEFSSLLATGVVRRDQGRFAEAVTLLRRSRAIAEERGDRLGVAATEYNLGFALREQGLWNDARTVFESALAVFREVDDSVAQARILYGLALVHAYEQRLDVAWEMLVDAERLARASVDNRWIAIILLGQGRICCHQGNRREGTATFQHCLALFREIGDRTGEAHVLRSLGIALRDQGAHTEGIACLGRAVDIVTALQDSRAEARVRHSLGVLQQRTGAYDEALDQLRQSLALSLAHDDRPWQARTLNRLGLLAAERRDWAAAAEHWSAADAALRGLQADALAHTLRRTRPVGPRGAGAYDDLGV